MLGRSPCFFFVRSINESGVERFCMLSTREATRLALKITRRGRARERASAAGSSRLDVKSRPTPPRKQTHNPANTIRRRVVTIVGGQG